MGGHGKIFNIYFWELRRSIRRDRSAAYRIGSRTPFSDECSQAFGWFWQAYDHRDIGTAAYHYSRIQADYPYYFEILNGQLLGLATNGDAFAAQIMRDATRAQATLTPSSAKQHFSIGRISWRSNPRSQARKTRHLGLWITGAGVGVFILFGLFHSLPVWALMAHRFMGSLAAIGAMTTYGCGFLYARRTTALFSRPFAAHRACRAVVADSGWLCDFHSHKSARFVRSYFMPAMMPPSLWRPDSSDTTPVWQLSIHSFRGPPHSFVLTSPHL